VPAGAADIPNVTKLLPNHVMPFVIVGSPELIKPWAPVLQSDFNCLRHGGSTLLGYLNLLSRSLASAVGYWLTPAKDHLVCAGGLLKVCLEVYMLCADHSRLLFSCNPYLQLDRMEDLR
jgi:hypothetical protein